MKDFRFTDEEIEEIKEANKQTTDNGSSDDNADTGEFGNDYLTPEDNNQENFNIGTDEEEQPQTENEVQK